MDVRFRIHYNTVWGQKLCVVGSIPQLGNWEPVLAKEMRYVADGEWTLELELPDSVDQIEYRYFVRMEDDHALFEEWERKHTVKFDKRSKIYTFFDVWHTMPANKVFYASAFTKGLSWNRLKYFAMMVMMMREGSTVATVVAMPPATP